MNAAKPAVATSAGRPPVAPADASVRKRKVIDSDDDDDSFDEAMAAAVAAEAETAADSPAVSNHGASRSQKRKVRTDSLLLFAAWPRMAEEPAVTWVGAALPSGSLVPIAHCCCLMPTANRTLE